MSRQRDGALVKALEKILKTEKTNSDKLLEGIKNLLRKKSLREISEWRDDQKRDITFHAINNKNILLLRALQKEGLLSLELKNTELSKQKYQTSSKKFRLFETTKSKARKEVNDLISSASVVKEGDFRTDEGKRENEEKREGKEREEEKKEKEKKEEKSQEAEQKKQVFEERAPTLQEAEANYEKISRKEYNTEFNTEFAEVFVKYEPKYFEALKGERKEIYCSGTNDYGVSYSRGMGGRAAQQDRFFSDKFKINSLDKEALIKVFYNTCNRLQEDVVRKKIGYKELEGRSFPTTDGTTCLLVAMCYIAGEKFIIAVNVGDSRAYLVTSDSKYIPLTFDHKPIDEDEKKRVEDGGGLVQYGHVMAEHLDVMYAISRAIGAENTFLNKNGKTIPGSHTPEITYVPVEGKNCRVFLGCDGIYDVLSTKNLEAIGKLEVIDEDTKSTDSKKSKLKPQEIPDAVLQYASKVNWKAERRADNLTAMTGSVDVVKKSEMIVLGVFDGNGATADVAQYCADNSARIINEEINKQRPSPSPMVDKIKNLFRKSEANVNSSTTRP